MSRGAAERRLVAAVLAVTLALAFAAAAPAQHPSSPASFELSRSVQQSLKRMQELWLQWLGASLQDNAAREAELVRSMHATARQVGFVRLPDLASGAAARALQAAADGDPARARRQLDAAESLDPGRPDLAFEAARLARREGDWLGAGLAAGRGVRRMFGHGRLEPLIGRLLLWALLALLVAAALFVLLEAALHGGVVYGDVQRWLALRMPTAAAHALAVLLLLGPLALPGGPLWLVLTWTVLLWGYGSRSERLTLAGVWLVLGLAPLGAQAIQRDLALAQSPPMRALADFGAGRLSGSLFADLQVLRGALPDDPAVLELIADVHRTLGQWEIARGFYRQVIAADGEVATALLNLGADAFRKGDFGGAAGYFQRAAATEPPSAAAWYNLSLAYSESYQFEDSRRALARAREVDGERVDEWISTPNPDRVLTFNGGLARSHEIARQLQRVWTASGSSGELGGVSRVLPAFAAGVAALLALVLHLARRGQGYGSQDRDAAAGGPPARWARALLPALAHVERGEGGAAALNLLLLAALATLPALASLGGDGEGVGPLRAASFVVAGAGAAAYLAIRIRDERGLAS